MFVGIEVRGSDIRRIRISCRCGNVFVAQIPQQLSRAHNVDDCPKCGALFHIQQDGDGKWAIERLNAEATQAFNEELSRQESKVETHQEKNISTKKVN